MLRTTPSSDMEFDKVVHNDARVNQAKGVEQGCLGKVKEVQGVNKVISSTSSYSSLDSVDEEAIRILPYREQGL